MTPTDIVQLAEQLRSLPTAMRELQQWLVWRYEPNPKKPDGKQLKVPYYVTGAKRVGKQGSDDDRRRLATFDRALAKVTGGGWSLGFAFLPGDGLIGVDIDGVIDQETGEVSELCTDAIASCASYTEFSPSGKGVHIIVSGHTDTNKCDAIGLEVFCESQFFTCTGRRWSDTPPEVGPIAEDALVALHARINAAKKQQRQQAAAPAALPAPAPAAAQPVRQEQPMPEKLRDALQAIPVAVIDDYNEWLQVGMGLKAAIGPAGFSLWDEWSSRGAKYPGAAELQRKWDSFHGGNVNEAKIFRLAVDAGWKPQRPTLVKSGKKPRVRRPEPPPEGEAAADDADADGGDAGADAPGSGDKGSGGGRRPPSKKARAAYLRLLANFALIYGTDQVWDGENTRILKIGTVRLAFGNDAVRMWLGSLERRLVMPEHVVFEPGAELPLGHVNLYSGLEMKPLPASEGDVQPMLQLLHHLCSTSASTDEGVEHIFTWVLRWIALLVQRPGVKIKTALVFHGPQGAGKNLFFDALRVILGKYGVMVGQNELEDKFNDWLSAKLLVIGNEVVTRQELYHNKNKLKWIITEDQIPIRAQHASVRWESNHANLIFLSNEHQPVALEYGDRRHLVIYTPMGRQDDLYARVRHFLDHEDGARKWLGYLLTVELGDYEPHHHPPMTAAKEVLIELGLKPPERFIAEWLAGYLPLPIQVCSSEQLYRAFRKWCDHTGERFPPPQPSFTRTAEKYINETAGKDAKTGEHLPPRLTYKVIALKDVEAGERKAARCWLPHGTGPKEGKSEGEWAWEAVEAFERRLQKFGRQSAIEEVTP